MAQEMIPKLGRDNIGNNDIENRNNGGDREALIENQNAVNAIDITHIAGVIAQEDINRLRRLIFRSTKGKSFIKT